ncbi:MAG: amidase family protein [Maritimibacter sp.]
MTISTKTAPHHWTTTETMAALNAREIGAEELLEHYLGRNASLGAEVNAVIEINEEAARIAARAVDAGTITGPLAGLPMSIKDCYEVEGFAATAGNKD